MDKILCPGKFTWKEKVKFETVGEWKMDEIKVGNGVMAQEGR